MKVLITGSAGLVGSECVKFFLEKGHDVVGMDNNMRAEFFGPEGSVAKNVVQHPRYRHCHLDIRSSTEFINVIRPHVIIHAAAQPSHDWAAKDPFTDFKINATGTLILLEAVRHHCPDAVFVYVSTNKVYGDRPNRIPLIEKVKG